MTQIKIFRQKTPDLLERDVNEWSRNTEHEVINISYISPRIDVWSAMVTYVNHGERR